MPEKVDLNVAPYYDDYDASKKYHKVLYRPSRPIQAREITQAQSILQNQIERFGDHMFKEGSIVSGGESNVDMDVIYVKVESSNPNSLGTVGVENYRTAFDTKYLQGKTSGVVVQVVTSYAETTSDAITYIVRNYKSGNDTENSSRLTAGEELQEVTLGADGGPARPNNNHQLQDQPQHFQQKHLKQLIFSLMSPHRWWSLFNGHTANCFESLRVFPFVSFDTTPTNLDPQRCIRLPILALELSSISANFIPLETDKTLPISGLFSK